MTVITAWQVRMKPMRLWKTIRAALYASAVRGRIASGPNAGNRIATFGGDRIDGDSPEAMSSPRCAAIAGFNLHGNVGIGPRDKERLERLSRPGIQRCCFNSCAAGVSSSAAVWIPRLQCHKPPCFLNYRRFKPLAHGDDVPPAYRGDIHPYLLVTSHACAKIL